MTGNVIDKDSLKAIKVEMRRGVKGGDRYPSEVVNIPYFSVRS